MDKKIGFIGLGNMGKWMALNLVKSGFEVTALDIDPQAVRFLTDQGAQPSQNPAELAGKTDWVFLSLNTPEIIETVLFGENGLIHGARPGLIVVDCGTTSYLSTVDFAKRLQERDQ